MQEPLRAPGIVAYPRSIGRFGDREDPESEPLIRLPGWAFANRTPAPFDERWPETWDWWQVGGTDIAAGWPLLALHAEIAGPTYDDTFQERARGGVLVPIPWTSRPSTYTRAVMRPQYILVPLTPIWSGLVINTLFYAAVLFVLIHTGRLMRSGWRAGRGGCPSCGYSLAGVDTCPECGWAPKRRAARA
ncbi:MAG: hypothetical protein RIB60_06690 [Phycisphaerales bacterium]